MKEVRQCASCGGFCKKSGCERANVDEPIDYTKGVISERDELKALLHQALDERDHYLRERDAWKESAEEQIALLNKIADERDALKAEVNFLEIVNEECKMDWSGDVTQIKAEHSHLRKAAQMALDIWDGPEDISDEGLLEFQMSMDALRKELGE